MSSEQTETIGMPPPTHHVQFSRSVLNVGFVFALILAAACLIMSGVYLLKFQSSANGAIQIVLNSAYASADTVSAGESEIVHAARLDQQYRVGVLTLSVHMYVARVLLLSCGILVGLSFGFLGFALFLIGVNGSVDATLDVPNRARVQVVRLAPGAFVIVCSAILIGICATRALPMSLSGGVEAVEENADAAGRRPAGVPGPNDSVDTRMPGTGTGGTTDSASTAQP